MNDSLRLIVAVITIVAGGCSNDSTTPSGTRVAVIAHRGASHDAPEHTIAAYDLALEQRADYIELDVARTRDGILVVIHDFTVDRTLRGAASDCSGRVVDRTLAELERCDAGSWFNSAYPDLSKPSYSSLRLLKLADVLDKYSSRARLYIEIKDAELYEGIEGEVATLLDSKNVRPGTADGLQRLYIQSFSPASLRRFRASAPQVPLILLTGDVTSAMLRDSLASIASIANGIGPSWESVDSALVDAAHARCLVVHPYTVNDEQKMRSLLKMGVDGIFTNVPDLLRRAIGDSPSDDRTGVCPS